MIHLTNHQPSDVGMIESQRKLLKFVHCESDNNDKHWEVPDFTMVKLRW